ncbi:hypothetical protein EG329_000641 [Mollisiaceae sp. DMI_Dod_QoI]|nr:hypothetical protein EG329_000641 [Helotiales sp. DMI_Dod_QoI]
MHTAEEIIGTWQLVTYKYFHDEAATQPLTEPLGPNPLGRLTFSSDGYMNAFISDPKRARPLDTPWLSASDKDVANIARAISAYCGQYLVLLKEGQARLCTDVEASLDPSWIGTVQERKVEFGELEGKRTLVLRPVKPFTLV